MENINKINVKTVFISTFLFGLLAHAFAYFNFIYNHDSVMVYSTDNGWQIVLGRYFVPIYKFVRGYINATWLIGILSLFFIACAALLIVDLLHINHNGHIIAVCGIMATNASVICLNATYMDLADVQLLALFMAVLSVWLTYKWKYGFLCGAVSLAVSLALYQSYISVFAALIMIYLIFKLVSSEPFKMTAYKVVQAVLCTAMSAVVYLIGLKSALSLSGLSSVSSTSGNNALTKLNDLHGMAILNSIKYTYEYFGSFFLSPELAINRMNIVINLLFLVSICICIICGFLIKKNDWKKKVGFVFILFLFPFGANITCFLSQGYVYELMTYSFYLVYLLPIISLPLLKMCTGIKDHWIIYLKRVLLICFTLIIIGNVILANQVYTKKKLVYDSTQVIVNRVLDRIEMTDGYIPGETPVYLSGTLDTNEYFNIGYSIFDALDVVTSVEPDLAVTYKESYSGYFKYIMNANVALVNSKEDLSSLNWEYIGQMPCFPQKDSCEMMDGVMVVKLSNVP